MLTSRWLSGVALAAIALMAQSAFSESRHFAVVFRPHVQSQFSGVCNGMLREVQTLAVTTVPCGIASSVQVGTYEAWIEWGKGVSPTLSTVKLLSGGGPARVIDIPVAAGALVSAIAPPGTSRVRLFSLRRNASTFEASVSEGSFWKQSLAGDLAAPILVPKGQVVAIGYDDRGIPTAISDIVAADDQRVSALDLKPPAQANVIAVLERGSPPKDAPDLALRGSSADAPAALIIRENTIVGLWYNRPERSVTIGGLGKRSWFPEQSVRLSPHRLAYVTGRLMPLPSLLVSFALPPGPNPKVDSRLRLQRGADQPLADKQLSGFESVTFEDIAPGEYLLILDVDRFTFRRHVDLTSGTDASVSFELSPISVTGEVLWGGKPAAATVTLMSTRGLSVDTDETGAFSFVVWQPGRYGIRTELKAEPKPPTYEDLIKISEADHDLKIDIPRNSIDLQVQDRETRHPIAGVKLSVRNDWTAGESGGRGTIVSVLSNEGGTASLPPVHPGTLMISAQAPGYAELSGMRVEIGPDEVAKTIPVVLERSKESGEIRITLADGSPAAGATVYVLDNTGSLVSSTTAGDEGRARLHIIPGQHLIIRHPQGATIAREYFGESDADEITLAEPASPLKLRIVDSEGLPVPSASIVLFAGGIRLRGNELALYSGFATTGSVEGYFLVWNAPRAALKVVVRRSNDRAATDAGNFDYLAQEVPFPWGIESTIRIQN